MPPPPQMLEEFYKTKTAAEIQKSDGHLRSGFVRAQPDGSASWQQCWAVLDAGADCAVVCLCRGKGDVRPSTVLALSSYNVETLTTEEVQGPTDFAFEVTDHGDSGTKTKHHLFCLDSGVDRDTWVNLLSNAVQTAGGDAYTDVTGMTDMTDVTAFSHSSYNSSRSSVMPPPDEQYPGPSLAGAVPGQGVALYPSPQQPALQTSETATPSSSNGVATTECTVVKEDGPELGVAFQSRTKPSGDGIFYLISRVEVNSVAAKKGLQTGMELNTVQGQVTSDLDPESVRRLMMQRPLHIVATQHSTPTVQHIVPAGSASTPVGGDSANMDISKISARADHLAGELDGMRGEVEHLRREALQRQAELDDERRARVELSDRLRTMMRDQEALVSVNHELEAQLEELRGQLSVHRERERSQREAEMAVLRGTQSVPVPESGFPPPALSLAPSVRMIAPQEHQQPATRSPFSSRLPENKHLRQSILKSAAASAFRTESGATSAGRTPSSSLGPTSSMPVGVGSGGK